MNLFERLETLPAEATLIHSTSGIWNRLNLLEGLVEIRDKLKGGRVALSLSDPGEALRVLAALDGVAAAVAILSPSGTPDVTVGLVIKGDFDAIFCDDPALFSTISDVPPVVSDLQSLSRVIKYRSGVVETRWVMATSGTTSEPKLVSHSLASLTRTTKTEPHPNMDICWGLLFDYSRYAGLQVLLQSVLSGAKLLAPSATLELGDRLDKLFEDGCTHLSATPSLWRKIIMTPGAEKLQLKQITLGGEIADERVLATLNAKFPQARITHIFASTEAGVGFSVNDRHAGFPEHYLQDPPAGISLRVADGRLFIRNELVERAYLGTEDCFAIDDFWVDTGDAVSINQGRVFFIGRASGVINVGGEKVYPEEVERCLLDHPRVVAVKVKARKNPFLGSVVTADVVLNDPSDIPSDLKAEIQAFASASLERYKVPAVIRYVQDLNLNAAGKIERT